MKIAGVSTLVLSAFFAVAIGATAPIAQDATPSTDDRLAELMDIGEPIYVARCKECHGAAGGGFVGPKLVGNDRIGNAELVIRQITGGGADMPAFRTKLTPDEIVAVGSYIRNAWGNGYGVLPE